MNVIVSNSCCPLTPNEIKWLLPQIGVYNLGLLSYFRAVEYEVLDLKAIGLSVTKAKELFGVLEEKGLIYVMSESDLRIETREFEMEALPETRRKVRKGDYGPLSDYWDDMYSHKLIGQKYSWTIMDYSILKNLQKRYGDNKLSILIVKFFSLDEDDVAPYGYSVRNFASKIEQLLSVIVPPSVTGVPDTWRQGE
jgi:hypothetical protein